MKVEIRSNDCAVISGYVNAVERRSRVISRPGAPPFREIVRPGTFRKALESGEKVELMLNHERTLCDTTSGLELREDNVGLYAKAEINDRETVEAARAGRLTGWSFGFVCRADTWKKDEDGTELSDFMVKSLNVWYRNKDNEFVDADRFMLCGTDKSFADYRGAVVNIGLDLSSGGDLTSWTAETALEDGAFFIDGHSYMPRGRFEEHIKTDTAPYDVWEKNELITVTGGNMDFKNDYGFIIRDLKAFVDAYDLKINCIGYDPHNADGILGLLESTFGAPMMPVTQSARALNDATCDIQNLVRSQKYFYNRRNELLIYSFMNAVTVQNSFGEIKIDKQRKTGRIDPVDAAIDAHFISCGREIKQAVDVNRQLEEWLAIMNGS